MAKIRYNELLKNRLEDVTYDSKLLSIRLLSDKYRVNDEANCMFCTYKYKFTLKSNSSDSIEEAIRTVARLRHAFTMHKPISGQVASYEGEKRVFDIIPLLADIDYGFINAYHTADLECKYTPKDNVKFGNYTLEWNNKCSSFILGKLDCLFSPCEYEYHADTPTYLQLYRRALAHLADRTYESVLVDDKY